MQDSRAGQQGAAAGEETAQDNLAAFSASNVLVVGRLSSAPPFDSYVGLSRSSSSQDEPEPQPGVQPMKSAGSVGHPDTCKDPREFKRETVRFL